MRYRRRPVLLLLNGLLSLKKACVKKYVVSTEEKLTLHFLPGYAPDLNPGELKWFHVGRAGMARSPLRTGEKLDEKTQCNSLKFRIDQVSSAPFLTRRLPPTFATVE